MCGEGLINGMENESPTTPGRLGAIWRNEDFWAVWLGLALLLIGLSVYLPAAPGDLSERVAQVRQQLAVAADDGSPHRSLGWYQTTDALNSLRGTTLPAARSRFQWVAPPARWQTNPVDALWLGEQRADLLKKTAKSELATEQTLAREMFGRAVVAQAAAAQVGFANSNLNTAAADAIRSWRRQLKVKRDLSMQARQRPHLRLGYILGLAVLTLLIFVPIVQATSGSGRQFARAFLMLFPLAMLTLLFAAQADLADSGLTYPLCAILIGLLAGRLLPGAADAARRVRPGLFLKLGLILMAAQAVLPQLLALPQVACITLAAIVILAILLWLLLPALVERDELRAGPLLAIDIGVGGHSALLGLGAMTPLRSQALVLVLLLSSLWVWLAIATLPNLFGAMGVSDQATELLLASQLDPGALGTESRYPRFSSGVDVVAAVAAAKWTLFALLAVVMALALRPAGGEGPAVRSPLLLAGGVMIAVGITSLVAALKGANWSTVMLDRGLFPGWTIPLRDWCFSIALLAYAMRADVRALFHAAGRERIALVYLAGQLVKLIMLLPLVALLI